MTTFRILIALIFATSILSGQSSLELRELMKGNDFVGHLPGSPNWSDDGKAVYFNWNPEMEMNSSLYSFRIDDLTPEKVPLDVQRELPSFFGDFSEDRSEKIYTKNGDIFVYSISDGTTKQLTNTIQNESNVRFGRNGIIFRQANNLYRWTADGIAQITNFQSGSERG